MATQIEDTQRTQGLDESRLSPALSDVDIADIICILHPCSMAAFNIAVRTSSKTPQHILHPSSFDSLDTSMDTSGIDLALRFSSTTISPRIGFTFGRNPSQCDVVLSTDSVKRVSNVHFRIYINESGVCMLEDLSTNGTLVDEFLLRGKGFNVPQTRMLSGGSIIQILSPNTDEAVKFIVRIPSREGHAAEYTRRFHEYRQRIVLLEEPSRPNSRAAPQGQPLLHDQWGMHWNGAPTYNCIGLLGKGAFASVFRLATRADGRLFAAKELDKRKFLKNGVLDRKLDNEMQIMETITHDNIVQFVEYHEHTNYLYIVMEYVPFGDLQQLLAVNGVLSESLAQTMARQVFDAMNYLHSKNITHRDIKPDNILIADASPASFHVKLSDFGLSKVVKDNDTFLKTFCGTLLYCAPEVFPHYGSHVISKKNRQQQHRFHSYSQSVDVWSFGAVLWYSLCGKPPFEGVLDNTGRGMFERIMTTELDQTPLLMSSVSDAAFDFLVETLQTDPSLRPTPVECLAHSWLDPSGSVCQGAANDMSQLNLDASDPFDMDSFHDAKRQKVDDLEPERSDSCNASPPPMDNTLASSGVLGSTVLPQSAVQSMNHTALSQSADLMTIDPTILPQFTVQSKTRPAALSQNAVRKTTDGGPGDEHIFTKPAPILGRLSSTPLSFANMTLNLSQRKTSWGRAVNNTLVYPDSQDTRVPKRALIILFYAPGILTAEAEGEDWTCLPGLQCLLATESTFGIWINGQHMSARDGRGRQVYCRLYSGDEICTCAEPGPGLALGVGIKFVCEFYCGEARKRRVDVRADADADAQTASTRNGAGELQFVVLDG